MPVFSATVAYRGEAFHGFARQPGQTTVQGDIEHALSLIFRRDIETVCAGRTDAGVHARGQVVSFELTPDDIAAHPEAAVARSLNALTDDAVSIGDLRRRPDGFSARFDAVAREYRYLIATGDTPPLFIRDFSWYIPGDLDIEAMREGAARLIGEHDFKSFCVAASAEGKTTMRNVERIDIDTVEVFDEPAIRITVVGNAFLHSMVRTIVGTLVAVGKGRRRPAWVGDVLQACDRSAAGENAPAAGLIFWQVSYPEEKGE